MIALKVWFLCLLVFAAIMVLPVLSLLPHN
jgi:hypothetical protein